MNKPIRKVAVLGAGVMGAQIAAHVLNAGIDALLFELPAKDGDPNNMVNAAIKRLTKLKPAPLGEKSIVGQIQPCNYGQHLPLLRDCDLIIEAIAERMDWKKDLYEKIAPYVNQDTMLASNTSGLSMAELSSALPEQLQDQFCGVHFFNPPRYMKLVELIPTTKTSPEMLDQLESFLTTYVGKGVVRAKDTPNFIGNRVGVFSILATMHHTRAFDLGFDVVDSLSGPAIGRPKSATYRTADVVGLDTMKHVISTMTNTLPDDPWKEYYQIPTLLEQLVEGGALGQKTGAGYYRKQGRAIQVLDANSGEYVDSNVQLPDDIKAILKISNPTEKMAALRQSDSKYAQFMWSMFRDLFHYCAFHLNEIAASAREIDQAMRWGYGWKMGPFETWQASGWQTISGWIAEDIAAGKTMSNAPLPAWVNTIDGVHSNTGSFSAQHNKTLPRSDLEIYQRQLQPERLHGEANINNNTVENGDDYRLWTNTNNDDVLILSFTSKMNSISLGVIKGILRAVELAEQQYKGLVIWQDSERFCVGADLKGALTLAKTGNLDGLHDMLASFQNAVMRLKYSQVPTVAAVRGLALGGGCEILMQCSHVVAAFESYIGLVEVGVGLLPGGGGLKELAIRAVENTKAGDSMPLLQQYYQQVAMAKVAGSALEARQFGYLTERDTIVMHSDEILHTAINQARSLHAAAYRPPVSNKTWPAAGDVGVATLKMMLVNMLEGQFISEHDMEIGTRVATVICGGEVNRGAKINEQWLLNQELEHFLDLAQMDKTQARIEHMLTTGKPLRN